jgi:hypothetical protein
LKDNQRNETINTSRITAALFIHTFYVAKELQIPSISSSIRGTVFAANIDIGVAIYQCERPEWASSHA